MTNWQPVDLTGDPAVEEQIRQYYIRKKAKEDRLKVVFREGVATEPRQRVEFTIDNSYMHEVSKEELDIHNRNNSKAWERYYKGDKIRRRYEDRQREEYTTK